MFNLLGKIARSFRSTAPAPFLMKANRSYARHKIGRYSYGYPNVITWAGDNTQLTIGAFCSFAGGVTILLGGDHHVDWVTTYPLRALFPGCEQAPDQFRTKGNIEIGNDVWIGQDAMIMAGVKIGNGAVIAARSVVTKDIPPYAIAGGIPARVIRLRFSEEVIAGLERIRWWEWNDEQIRQAAPMLLRDDVRGFISKYAKVSN